MSKRKQEFVVSRSYNDTPDACVRALVLLMKPERTPSAVSGWSRDNAKKYRHDEHESQPGDDPRQKGLNPNLARKPRGRR